MTPAHQSNVASWNAPFPVQQWYIAALSEEVGSAPLARTLLGKPVVMYRTADGEPVALFDRCPHRGLPLSAGAVVGGNIRCGYHGIQFGADGLCKLVPSGGQVSPLMKVESYQLVDRDPFIWIWMGDPDGAAPAAIPDLAPFGLGMDGWHLGSTDVMRCEANYLLPFENLLDASHITFLHHGQIDSGDVAELPFTTEQKGSTIRVVREARDELQSPLTMKTYGFAGERAHRTIIADAHVPSFAGIRVELRPVGAQTAPPAVTQLIVGITPVTAGRCIEFTATLQNFPQLNPNIKEDARNLLMEDVVAMEQIQALYNELGDDLCPEVSVRSDAAAWRARRLFLDLLGQERNDTPAVDENAERVPALS